MQEEGLDFGRHVKLILAKKPILMEQRELVRGRIYAVSGRHGLLGQIQVMPCSRVSESVVFYRGEYEDGCCTEVQIG